MVRGRPPAKWMHRLAELDRSDDDFLDYHDLCELFQVSKRIMHGFCTKLDIPGEYYRFKGTTVRKRFKVRDLKLAAKKYIEMRSA